MLLAACVEILRQCCQHQRIPRTDPMVGQVLTAEYRVRWYDLVSVTYPAICKPHILASARLVHWCEHIIMASLTGCQLGTGIKELSHEAPAVWKSTVTITAQCTEVNGRRSTWAISAVDNLGELIAAGSLGFAQVHPVSYTARRVQPKKQALRTGSATTVVRASSATVTSNGANVLAR